MPTEVREYRAGGFNLHGGLTRGAHFPLGFALGHLGWFVRARPLVPSFRDQALIWLPQQPES